MRPRWLRISPLAFAVACLFALSCTKPKEHSVTVIWQAPVALAGVKGVGYNLYRSTISGGPYTVIASRLPTTLYDDKIVKSGTTYFYVVTTVDADGHESRQSEEIKVTVP